MLLWKGMLWKLLAILEHSSFASVPDTGALQDCEQASQLSLIATLCGHGPPIQFGLCVPAGAETGQAARESNVHLPLPIAESRRVETSGQVHPSSDQANYG